MRWCIVVDFLNGGGTKESLEVGRDLTMDEHSSSRAQSCGQSFDVDDYRLIGACWKAFPILALGSAMHVVVPRRSALITPLSSSGLLPSFLPSSIPNPTVA